MRTKTKTHVGPRSRPPPTKRHPKVEAEPDRPLKREYRTEEIEAVAEGLLKKKRR
jgi:hypothetical protein